MFSCCRFDTHLKCLCFIYGCCVDSPLKTHTRPFCGTHLLPKEYFLLFLLS